MSKKISIGAAIAITLVGCVMTFQTTYLVLHNRYEKQYTADAISVVTKTNLKNGSTDTTHTANTDISSDFMARLEEKIGDIDYIFRNYYIGELDDDTLLDMVAAGYIAGTGDDYAAYYSAEGFADFMNDMEGEMSGIGINVIYNADYHVIEIISVMPDSPALEAGLMAGDFIVYVGVGEDKMPVSELGYNPSVAKLRGPEGTEAVFTVARGENHDEMIDFHVVRKKIESQSVLYHVYVPDNAIGVIKITGFDSKTPEQFVAAVEDLTQNANCERLIIDLRYNPGGELSSIVTVLDYILPKGPIIRIFDANGNMVDEYDSEATELNIPMAVLVNGSTASAAELFTSALRDYDKAVIVGTTTFGKGCMQTTIPLSDGSAISVTYRMYSPPYGENYHGVGITPNIEVELDKSLSGKNIYKITDEEDNQLAAAAEAVRSR